MTSDEFAKALSRLVGEAEDAGLTPEELIHALENAAAARQGIRSGVEGLCPTTRAAAGRNRLASASML